MEKINYNEILLKTFLYVINDYDNKVFNNRIKKQNNFSTKKVNKINFVISNCQNKSLFDNIAKIFKF